MAIVSSTFTSAVLLASPELYRNKVEPAGNDNPAYLREETLRSELGTNDQLGCSKDCTANGIQTSEPISHQIPPKTDQMSISERVSFANDNSTETEIKLYKKRFWILALFSVCSMLSGMQWMQYTVISDATICFYGIDIYAVNWTANIFLILYAPLVFPVSWFAEKVGSRNSLLTGSFLTCVGTAIQCIATTPDTFYLVMVSQGFGSVAQNFIVSLPPYISATWFGEDEVSRASAVGIFGNQLGTALGFIFTPLVTSTDCTDKNLIARGRKIVAYTLVSCNILVFVLILATFNSRPKIPPSLAEAKKTDIVKDFKSTICALLKNTNYMLLLIANGIIIGVALAVSTVLFSLVSIHFHGKDTVIGWMGLTAILAGTVGAVVAGYVLDCTHRFKETSVAIFALSLVSMILFSGLLYANILWLQFIISAVFGFFVLSYLPVGMEFAVEITYPGPEAVSATLLIASTTVVGLVLSVIGTYLVENFSDVAANSFFCATLLLGTILTAVIKCDYRRQKQRKDQTS